MQPVTLRYLDCRGRAEPLRHLLRARGVAFTDHREPIDDLRRSVSEYRSDASRGGPFGLLPVLDWGEARVSQALPIANFLSRELGLHAGLDGIGIAREEALSSAAYLELTVAVIPLVWAPLWYAEAPLERQLKFQSRIPCGLPARLESLLAAGADYFGGHEPHAPDFFVFEGLSAWIKLFGEPYAEAVRRKPRLGAWWARLSAELEGQPGLERPITASPYEGDIVERARRFVQEQGLPWPV